MQAAVLRLQHSVGNAATTRMLARSPDPAAIADEVIAKEDYMDPHAAGGIGDYRAAFDILIPLETDELLQVLLLLHKRYRLELLRDHFGAARDDRERLRAAILAVFYLTDGLTKSDLSEAPRRMRYLDASVKRAFRRFLASMPSHRVEVFVEGAEDEVERLAGAQAQFWEDKRKAQEAEEKRRQEEEAKKRNLPPPQTPPKVEVGDVIGKEVEERKIKPIPTDEWDKLSDADKNNWKSKRAPAAFARLTASIKGTELEQVMKGHPLQFKPREMLERGGYAWEAGGALAGGMSFVKDIEADPKNVWGIIAHEIGGHAEYGKTYASFVMEKALKRLPEAEQKKWKEPKARTALFDAFAYSETEIYAALRQRRYDVPESGPMPTHGAIKPDANIEIRLKAIDAGFPKEVGTAILMELNDKVRASSEILARDKQYFLDQVKKHGYTL